MVLGGLFGDDSVVGGGYGGVGWGRLGGSLGVGLVWMRDFCFFEWGMSFGVVCYGCWGGDVGVGSCIYVRGVVVCVEGWVWGG